MANGSTLLWLEAEGPLAAAEYSVLNVLATSLVPLPLAASMVVLATLLFGLLRGLLLNSLTTLLGAWISLWLTRYACRPCFLRSVGRYQHKWQALDAAITKEGAQIALLVRLAPVAPFVLSSVLLSLTSISQTTYCLITLVAIIPSNLPYAYAAQLGISLADSFPPKDPVLVFVTIIGLVASLLFVWKEIDVPATSSQLPLDVGAFRHLEEDEEDSMPHQAGASSCQKPSNATARQAVGISAAPEPL